MIIACGRNVFTDEFVQERGLLYFTFSEFWNQNKQKIKGHKAIQCTLKKEIYVDWEPSDLGLLTNWTQSTCNRTATM